MRMMKAPRKDQTGIPSYRSGRVAEPLKKAGQPSVWAALQGLQRTHGNNYVQRVLNTASAEIQTKLKVSQPGDPWELEADQIAHQVMSMSRAAAIEPGAGHVGADEVPVQRMCPECEDESLQRASRAE